MPELYVVIHCCYCGNNWLISLDSLADNDELCEGCGNHLIEPHEKLRALLYREYEERP